MKFLMKINEIQYIQEYFHFQHLLCVEKNASLSSETERALLAAGILKADGSGRYELRTEERLLFSSWEKMRFSVIRADNVSENGLYCILANEKEIIIFDQEDSRVEFNVFDFDAHVMDNIFCALGEIDASVSTTSSFNVTLSVEEFTDLISASSPAELQKKAGFLGINPNDLQFFISAIKSQENCSTLLCEDHQKCVGALTKIVNTEKCICALKHITPQDLSNERFTMIMGNAQKVVDSLYIL